MSLSQLGVWLGAKSCSVSYQESRKTSVSLSTALSTYFLWSELSVENTGTNVYSGEMFVHQICLKPKHTITLYMCSLLVLNNGMKILFINLHHSHLVPMEEINSWFNIYVLSATLDLWLLIPHLANKNNFPGELLFGINKHIFQFYLIGILGRPRQVLLCRGDRAW